MVIFALFIIALILFIRFFPAIWGEALYPLEYKDEIQSASIEFGLEKNFISAVIYTESHFNPEAKSGAGAKGLMQLMPATARGVADAIAMTDYTDSRVFEPAINIRLGSAYLKQQYDKYSGNYNAVLAHYNGGPVSAGIYLASGKTFLNRETFHFIDKVNNAWSMYDKIYGKNWEGGGTILKNENPFIQNLDIKNLFQFVLGK